jgi:hypothetical protein
MYMCVFKNGLAICGTISKSYVHCKFTEKQILWIISLKVKTKIEKKNHCSKIKQVKWID